MKGSDMREWGLFGAGLAMGAVNTVRHKASGYTSPRPFSPYDLQRTAEHAISVVDRLEQRGRITWEGKSVLELGPGSDLTTGLVMLDRGASIYHAVDAFDNRWQASPDVYRYLADKLGTSHTEEELSFVLTTFPDLPDVAETYDVVVSNACLEHVAVDEIGALFRRLRELTLRDGRMVHHIDGKAHMRWFRDHDPLNHLRYSDLIYRHVLDFPGAPNRLRASDFRALAEDAGWSASAVAWRTEQAYAGRTHVARRFRRYPDLDVLTFTLVAEPAKA
jgi:cyclopropane fatty-acyl-phospholipid synthase-like methyltransferase